MKFIIFQGLTADKDGNTTEMGKVAINITEVTGVLECVDKHECVIKNCCSILFRGGGQITVKGTIDAIIESIEGNQYGQ